MTDVTISPREPRLTPAQWSTELDTGMFVSYEIANMTFQSDPVRQTPRLFSLVRKDVYNLMSPEDQTRMATLAEQIHLIMSSVAKNLFASVSKDAHELSLSWLICEEEFNGAVNLLEAADVVVFGGVDTALYWTIDNFVQMREVVRVVLCQAISLCERNIQSYLANPLRYDTSSERRVLYPKFAAPLLLNFLRSCSAM